MSIDVARTIEQSIDRVTTPAGGALILALSVVTALYQLGNGAITAGTSSSSGSAGASQLLQTPAMELASGMGMAVGGALLLVGVLGMLIVYTIASDAFARGVDQPGDLGTSGLGWKVGNLFVGWIAYAIAVTIGLIFLVIPGLVIAVLLMFFPFAIAVDGESVFSAFGTSVEIVRENVLATLGIVVVTFVVGVANLIISVLTLVIPSTAVAFVVSALVAGVFAAFTTAILTSGYVQGTDGSDAGPGMGDDAGTPGQVA